MLFFHEHAVSFLLLKLVPRRILVTSIVCVAPHSLLLLLVEVRFKRNIDSVVNCVSLFRAFSLPSHIDSLMIVNLLESWFLFVLEHIQFATAFLNRGKLKLFFVFLLHQHVQGFAFLELFEKYFIFIIGLFSLFLLSVQLFYFFPDLLVILVFLLLLDSAPDLGLNRFPFHLPLSMPSLHLINFGLKPLIVFIYHFYFYFCLLYLGIVGCEIQLFVHHTLRHFCYPQFNVKATFIRLFTIFC